MNTYKVIGESREVGAIGIFEPFIDFIDVETSKQAYNQVREKLYAHNREHVHIKQIYLKAEPMGWLSVNPTQYL
jgi:hypothetical protein